MKIPHPAIIRLAMSFFVFFVLFSCSKDTDLLSEYVVSSYPEAKIVRNLVVNDNFFSYGSETVTLDVLANDTFIDPENVEIVKTTDPQNGTVIINEDQTLTYIKNSNDEEPISDTFTYTTEVVEEDESTNMVEASVTIQESPDYGVLKAFPTAYGAGSNVSGGRGKSVYIVTNLSDSGFGSFRDAVSKSDRTIVFAVSGTIELKNNLHVQNVNNITIAGQTAPEGGITLTGKTVFFKDIDNLILRYVRFRPRWITGQTFDGLNFDRVTNAIIDHCSVSWGGDEAISFAGSDNNNVFATYNITLQRTLMGESTKGCIVGYSSWENASPKGRTGGDFTVNQNMWVNISHRFPGISTEDRLDVINNVVHNWQRLIMGNTVATNLKLNAINNYWQRGCMSNVIEKHSVCRMDYRDGVQTRIYSKGNIINGEYTDPNALPNKIWLYWIDPPPGRKALDDVDDQFFVENPFDQLGHSLNIISAENALVDVTNNVGANAVLDGAGNKIISSDIIDERYINQAKNNICEPYTFPPDPRQYDHYKAYHNSVSNIPINARPLDFDSDKDGMPDAYELSQDLNPQDSKDGSEDRNGDGYTNLEDYLNLIDF